MSPAESSAQWNVIEARSSFPAGIGSPQSARLLLPASSDGCSHALDNLGRVNVELLYWEGCPSYPEAHELLEEVLRDRGLDVDVTVRQVDTPEEAETLRFPGSPTIRIDGRDVDPDGASGPPSLSCRIYQLAGGKVSPVPSRQQLEEALR